MRETAKTGSDDLTIEQPLAAPAALVWSMWTEPDRFAGWYGPDGATVTVDEMDVRVDGVRRVSMEMETPGGPMRMQFSGQHTVVEPEARLSYTEAMGDAATAAHGATEVTVTLSEADGTTTMVLTHAGVAADSPGAAGWRMALDKLAAALER